MKNRFSLITIIFSSIILLMTVKGVLGNVGVDTIQRSMRGAGQAFELSPERNRYAQLLAWFDYGHFYLPTDVARMVDVDVTYANGHYTSVYPPGVTIAVLPFYLLGKIVNADQLATNVAQIFYVVCSAMLLFAIGKKLGLHSSSMALAIVLLVFGTSGWAYSTVLYQHWITLTLLLGLLYISFLQLTVKNAIVFGFLSALLVMVDYPNVIFATPIFLYQIFKDSSWDNMTREIKLRFSWLLLVVGMAAIPLGIFWGYYNAAVFNNPLYVSATAASVKSIDQAGQPVFATASRTEKTTSSFIALTRIPQGFSVLFTSKDRGILWYSPYLLLGLLSFLVLRKKQAQQTSFFYVIVASIICFIILYAGWGDPWGGWAFGPRYLIPAVGLFTPFVALAIDSFKKNKVFILFLTLLALYSFAVNALGAVTSNQVPPYHEAVGLGMKYNYLINIDYIKAGKSGAFLYTSIFKNFMPLWGYYGGVLILVCTIFTFTLINAKKTDG